MCLDFVLVLTHLLVLRQNLLVPREYLLVMCNELDFVTLNSFSVGSNICNLVFVLVWTHSPVVNTFEHIIDVIILVLSYKSPAINICYHLQSLEYQIS